LPALCPRLAACLHLVRLPADALPHLRPEASPPLALLEAWLRSPGRLAEALPQSAAPAGVGEQSFAERAEAGLADVDLAHQG
jgi:hypothetical protein